MGPDHEWQCSSPAKSAVTVRDRLGPSSPSTRQICGLATRPIGAGSHAGVAELGRRTGLRSRRTETSVRVRSSPPAPWREPGDAPEISPLSTGAGRPDRVHTGRRVVTSRSDPVPIGEPGSRRPRAFAVTGTGRALTPWIGVRLSGGAHRIIRQWCNGSTRGLEPRDGGSSPPCRASGAQAPTWRSVAARGVRGAEAVGSNPASPTAAAVRQQHRSTEQF